MTRTPLLVPPDVGRRPASAAHGRGLTKVYGTGDTRPSGSGKSTLMHCMAGLDGLTEGQAWIGDTELSGLENTTLPLDIAGRALTRALSGQGITVLSVPYGRLLLPWPWPE